MKLLELIQITSDYFQKQGVDSPRLNAEQLIAFGLGVKRLDLYLQFDREIDEGDLARLRNLVKRRASREPLQHIIGTAEFYGYTFKSDARALVPRPETEKLVELALSKATQKEGVLWDVGTGSGVIAITFLLQKPGWKAIASDISSEALALTQENAEKLKVVDRLQLIQCNLLEETMPLVDIIVSNPPYLPTSILKNLSPEVQADPEPALDGGENGLAIIRNLIEKADNYLKSGGWLLLEMGEDQKNEVMHMGEQSGLIEIEVLKDLSLKDRYFVAQKAQN
ncbi:MAG: peptide chain release factor N(5)-glutamine methyltransferase [Verrucomicrobiae bacterium]|nr:peptide chain release factor N(5)-glutamine methyltransferase [Verrucomicrobiae bacterium]